MGHSDCLVLFSNFENFPCVIPEAYSCGIPVISSKVGGIEEYVTDALGVLVPKGDETALFDAFVGMLDQRYTYSRERIRSYAVQEFSYEAIGKSFKDSYSMALQLTNVTTKSSN